MIQTYQPPVMEVSHDTLPELQRIFTFLNSHSNKLYQEGYFLKFHDTDTRGRPAPDRVWQECFAQLVGTILSLWDATELDKVGGDAEVLPTFINLTDAAVHMMPSMVLTDGKKLDNILSISTAASNKYLFHFNSFNSLTQWTAGIRLAMYEHVTLQEAYTGALIAGKGRALNNIRIILDRQRAPHEDWARVRFGAGTPWRRCWCVVTPPDEKEFAKLQKTQKKSNPYQRTAAILKGDMKFYDTKKITKKTRPIATVREAYSCYAIYPQSKPLIDQSTLVKIEGKITIHSNPESVTEGFVFVMPETHPAVSGFEIMLRFLFPVFDTFALYGRPNKLIADVLDTRGLMFAMPPDRRYGYLEMWDVVSLIHTEGSQNWSERQWRKELKDLTSKRMTATPSRNASRAGSRRNTVGRASLPPSRSGPVRFEDRASIHSQPSTRQPSPTRLDEFAGPRRVDSAPPTAAFATPRHQRSVSEANGYKKYHAETPSRLAQGSAYDSPPSPPTHGEYSGPPQRDDAFDTMSDGEPPSPVRNLPEVQIAPTEPPRGPVALPPSFAHGPGDRPPTKPYHPPPMMKPNSQLDPATLDQLADATHTPIPAGIAAAGAAAAWRSQDSANGRHRYAPLARPQDAPVGLVLTIFRYGPTVSDGQSDYDREGGAMHMHANSRGYPADHYLQSANTSHSGHSGSRLPTIPASPYIEQPEFVESTYEPTAPPVPEHAELPQFEPATELAHRPRPGSGSVQRKPLPVYETM
jgi:CCR4-NOT transcriptional complex subunit CAF120